MSCPWAKIEPVEPVSFQDILSEEVARGLQAKEDSKYSDAVKPAEGPPLEIPAMVEIPDHLDENDEADKSDEMIAKMLQMQFDKEYDEDLRRREEKYNASSKVRVSFDNYRRAPQNFDFESDSEEDEPVDIRDRRDWDRFDTLKRQQDSMPPCGYKVENGVMVTKHDIVMSARKNACKMLSFPPDFHTGDGENFDMKISNKVFNSLKRHSQIAETKRRHKVKDKKEDRATAEFGVDEFTRLLLVKWINAGILAQVNGTISIGKEAVIIHCDTNPDCDPEECDDIPLPLPAECAIKVFKTTLSEFKQRDKYIKDDHRFKDRIGNQTARKFVHLWAEKEMHNLTRLRNAGIPCPKVVALKKHVLMMSFIGQDGRAAPKLKDAPMTAADYIVAHDQVVETMKTLYHKAELVHADLSEYNILWHGGQCYFIDVSQSVMTNSENASVLLRRDCQNIYDFFTKKKVPGVASPDELFEAITGLPFEDKAKLNELRDSFKMKPHLVDKPGVESSYNFDKAWEDSLKAAQENQDASTSSGLLVEPPLA